MYLQKKFEKIASVFLKNVDFFGRKTELMMHKQSQYKTKIGGCFSIIMITMCVLLFINMGSDMIYHNNPTSLFSEVFIPFPEETYFSQEKYFFMFGIEASNYTHFIDESIYKATAINGHLNKDGTNSFIDVTIERCSESHLPSNSDIYPYFMNASGSPLNNLYCIQKGSDNNYMIKGAFDAEQYVFLDIKIEICKNSTDPLSPVCKPQEEIYQKMNGYFAFYTMDYLINPQNFYSPGVAVGKDYFSPISVGVTRNTNRYIATSRVDSDDGFLFEDKNTYTYPTYQEDKETFLVDSTNSGKIVEFRLRKYHNELVYDRKYKKLQTVLADIGGFIQIIYIIFFVLSYPFVSKLYFEKIINTIYNFELAEELSKHAACIPDSKSNNVDKEKEKRVKGITINDVFSDSNKFAAKVGSIKKSIEAKDASGKNEEFIKFILNINNKPALKTTFWEFLVGSLKKLRKKPGDEQKIYQQLEFGSGAISEKLDISYILKKFYEIDKIKMLLLDKDQYHLFEYLPKPLILKNHKIDLSHTGKSFSERGLEKKKTYKFISYENDHVAKAKKMYSAYQNILNKQQLSDMDKKLIDLMDDKIKGIVKVKLFLAFFYFNLLLFCFIYSQIIIRNYSKKQYFIK